MAKTLGLLPDGVTFAGRRDDVPALLKKGDVLLLPSDHEGFPNAVLEAMAAELPVVCTPAGDVGRVVVDGVTGYVLPFEDEQGMVDRVLLLARSEESRHLLGLAGRRRAEQQYSFDALAGRLLSVYHEVAGRLSKKRVLQLLSSYGTSQQWSEE